jgi:hypothetical protein
MCARRVAEAGLTSLFMPGSASYLLFSALLALLVPGPGIMKRSCARFSRRWIRMAFSVPPLTRPDAWPRTDNSGNIMPGSSHVTVAVQSPAVRGARNEARSTARSQEKQALDAPEDLPERRLRGGHSHEWQQRDEHQRHNTLPGHRDRAHCLDDLVTCRKVRQG